MRRFLTFAILLAAFGLAWWLLPKREHAPRAEQNLVLVIACTLRADQTSVGGPAETTPTLARWAAEGAVFTDVIAAAPWTRAASAALVTAHTPSSLGLAEPGPGGNDRALPTEAHTLAEALHAEGWSTLGASANPNLNAEFQFDQGFDAYESLSELWREGLYKVPGTEVNKAAERLLDGADPSRPTYLQLVYVDAHSPMDATEAETAPFLEDHLPQRVSEYRAQVHRLDTRLAELERLLAARGLTRDNTTFALVADHGEGLLWPEHHGHGHGLYLYPSTIHVPFVLTGRGVPAGVVVDGLVSGEDVAPTLAELVGVDFAGHSHAKALLGEDTARDRAFAATWFRSARRAAVYTSELACQRDYSPEVPAHPYKEKPPFPTGCFERAFPDFSERTATDPELADALDAWFTAEEEALASAHVERGAVEGELEAALKALGYATE